MGERLRLNQPEIVELYKAVINDVCEDIRECFLDENIDRDVLSQLKKEWEEKVNASGAVDLTPKPLPPAPLRSAPIPRMQSAGIVRMTPQQPTQQVVIGNRQPVSHMLETPVPTQRPIQMQYVNVQQPNISHIQPNQMGTVTFPQGAVRMVQAMQPNAPTFMQPGSMMFIQNSNGPPIPVTMGPNGIIQQRVQVQQQNLHQPSQQGLHQLDGGVDRAEETEESEGNIVVEPLDGPSSADMPGSSRKNTERKPTRKEAEMVLRGLLQSMQLDGGGGGMSDSSSDEEEDENDPLRRIADRIGDGQLEDGEGIVEEDPLNSGDDQSDEEDGDQAFDAVNVIMCQFEKIHRARNKWKFQLKDGIMHLVADNRDYCFHKCTGEAEW